MNCSPIVLAVEDMRDGITLQLDVPAELPCFHGHFPGFSILPGVVQIDWVMQLAAQHLCCSQPVAADFRVKFKHIITPGVPLSLTLRHDAQRRCLDFAYRSGDVIASQGLVTLAPP